MSTMFEETTIKGLVMKNRFVRSATWEGLADKGGAVTPALLHCMADLTKGGVGLIISGYAFIRKDGLSGPFQLGIDRDELLPGLKQLAETVHENGGRFIMQLAHGGFFAMAKLIGEEPFAPSVIPGLSKSPRRAMSVQDIQELVHAFAEGARRAKEAGCDGVQIHAAHGYLLSQFLSPAYNHRSDAYGGSLQNRARFLMESLQAIRAAVGQDYPVLVKMNSRDFIEGGLDLEEALAVGAMLEKEGIDAIELSGGFLNGGKLNPSRMGIDTEEKEAYFENEARAFRDVVSVPLILVGGTRSLSVAERIVTEGLADYISLSRPLIREPGLINRWKSGDTTKSACISCNRCFGPGVTGQGVYCVDAKRPQSAE